MSKPYGYNPLSYALIELFTSGLPDFEAAEKLIQQGADVNDQGDDKGENVLSEILGGYWQAGIDYSHEECKKCIKEFAGGASYDTCPFCEHFLIPNVGASMIRIIRFFLDHGFDVSRNEEKYGAQCLRALALSSFDRGIIEATKMLLDAGAQNIPSDDDEPDETPMDAIGAEGSFQDTCEHHHDLGNIYETVYQIYLALEQGRPYAGIDSFEAAMHKKILRVMAAGDHKDSVFTSINLPTSTHNNCFYRNIYTVFDGGYMVCTKSGSYWVDVIPLDEAIIDVSEFFSPIVGHAIQQVTFAHNAVIDGITHYGQPVTTFHFDNGIKLTFTTNFGEVEEGNSGSYYYFGDSEDPLDVKPADSEPLNERAGESRPDGVPISEEDFLNKIAKMYSEYAEEDIFHHMEPGFRYSSFWVFEEIISARKYVDYITRKVQTIKRAKAVVKTKMMHIRGSEKPCLILEQKPGKESVCLTVERSENGLISKMSMMPSSFYALVQ